MSSNNVGHLITSTIITLQHFTTLHHTSPNYIDALYQITTLFFSKFNYFNDWTRPFVILSPCIVNDYSLLVSTDESIILICISPHLVATCFDCSPSSGRSQPNSFKTHSIKLVFTI